ncbi:MAG: aminotransferase class I/II-fold pyridoxal phosphate-dependent enzyme, partial [Spirochaetales bacterium]|nr:aminotransferase class I/II-fold pyridoxal phosphate-dependent enzyme [Spirochaetales bacterium]
VFTLEELTQLVAIAATFKTMIISDEIHGDLTYAHNTHTPLGTLVEESGVECATCVAPSKTFNIAGQHFSAVICSSGTMYRKLTQRMETLRISPDILATVAASAAYSGGYGWLMDLNHYLSSQVNMIINHFNESNSGLLFVPPEASFIGLIDCSAIYERVAEEAKSNTDLYNPKLSPQGGLLSRFFGQKAAIAMNDGSWFGQGWERFVRFNFATSQGRVEAALKAITAAVAELN